MLTQITTLIDTLPTRGAIAQLVTATPDVLLCRFFIHVPVEKTCTKRATMHGLLPCQLDFG